MKKKKKETKTEQEINKKAVYKHLEYLCNILD